MMRHIRSSTAAILLGVGMAASIAFAQQSTPSQSQTPPAGQAPDDNSFPEAASQKAARDAAAKKKADAAQSTEQDSTNGSDEKPPAAENPAKDGGDNPFPEDTSRKAADAAKPSSASSSGVSSSSDYDNRATGSARNAVRANAPMPHLNGKDPVREDLNIGTYYLEAGDYKGAYQRFKEATTLAPENTDAMFGLAVAARHLKKRDEAMTNYQLFLDVVTSGPKAKDARKAIESLEKDK